MGQGPAPSSASCPPGLQPSRSLSRLDNKTSKNKKQKKKKKKKLGDHCSSTHMALRRDLISGTMACVKLVDFFLWLNFTTYEDVLLNGFHYRPIDFSRKVKLFHLLI